MKEFGSRFRSTAVTVLPKSKELECSYCQSSGFRYLSMAFFEQKKCSGEVCFGGIAWLQSVTKYYVRFLYGRQNVYISSQSHKPAVLSKTIIKAVIDIKKWTLNGWINPLPPTAAHTWIYFSNHNLNNILTFFLRSCTLFMVRNTNWKKISPEAWLLNTCPFL